ncbi:MAG: hypothetical protein ACT4PZ_04170 [Panacagrimonas sp.]
MRAPSIWLAFCFGLVASLPCRSAVPPLAELLASVPAPPGDVDTATGWVRDRTIAAPAMLDFEARLKAQKVALALPAAAAVQTGAATPQDSAAVLAAVEGYKAYFAANSAANNPAQVLGKRMFWLAGRFGTLKRGITDAYRVADLRKQELAAYGALFTDWQSKRAPVIQKAHRELAAAGDLAAVQSGENRAALQQYGLAMIGELETLYGLTRHSVETAAGIAAPPPAPATPGRAPTTLWDLMSNPPKKAS